jgi:acetyltransferase-like isoleucine patch superfamily enzyme
MIGHADIGDYTLTAQGCHFVSGDHPFNRVDIPIIQQRGTPGRVRVGPDIWLGVGVIVMADIGCGSVVGAGSVVTRPLPPMSVAVGSPAKVIRTRGQNEPNSAAGDSLTVHHVSTQGSPE